MSAVAASAPAGKQRSIGVSMLLFIVTLGFYGWYWVYKTQEEMKQETGEGLGGVLGLVIWILISAVSAFVIPSEVGRMFARAGKTPPVTGSQACPAGPCNGNVFAQVYDALGRYIYAGVTLDF